MENCLLKWKVINLKCYKGFNRTLSINIGFLNACWYLSEGKIKLILPISLCRLEGLIKKHEDLIPTVTTTQVKVDLYWKCYAYGDELKPHIEFLDGIMLSSTRDIAPSCIENVEELIERQEKSLSQLDTKRAIVKDLIEKGKKLLENPE